MLELLGFTRSAFEHGQYWRLLSAQFVHLNQLHALANWFALLVTIWFCHFFIHPRIQVLSFIGGLLGVACVLVLDSACSYYAGLSGALHGLWAGNALALLALSPSDQKPRLYGGAALLLLLGKLVLQQFDGEFTPAFLDLPVYRPAHWAGLVGGVVLIGVILFFHRSAHRQPQARAQHQ